MIKGCLNLPWFVWADLALTVAVAYSFVLRGISPSQNGPANGFALAGDVMYFLFMSMSFIVK